MMLQNIENENRVDCNKKTFSLIKETEGKDLFLYEKTNACGKKVYFSL